MTEMNGIESIARSARTASRVLATLSTEVKNRVLTDLADAIELSAESIRQANETDIAEARKAGLAEAKLKRLVLSDAALRQLYEGLRKVVQLPDPVGAVAREYTVPSGLRVRRVRSPIGVILMIYEARPNVTIDAFALCFKAGNACILKGGREAHHSNRVLLDLIRETLSRHSIPTETVALVTGSDRDEMKSLLAMTGEIDLVIPRGGTELIRFVHEHSKIPMVQHFQGVCHIFVDQSADERQALDICVSAKTSAPAACNAVETILVHSKIVERFVPLLVDRMAELGVEIRGDSTTVGWCPKVRPAMDDDWGREFLDLIVAIKVVKNIDEAIAHIHRFGSNHTEAILSRDEANQKRFQREVQASCTVVNASTRFNDGFQLGLGAEIGISTSKIHAFGPMGLEELTIQRFNVVGDGQVR